HKSDYFDPDFLYIQNDSPAKSKFEHLYGSYPTITGVPDLKLGEYINNQVLTGAQGANGLKAQLDALKILEKLPTARLERLFIEHIDCCNYRIDAWKLGLIKYRLIEQRKLQQSRTHSSSGLYLGAYGWLIDVKPKKS